MKKIKNKKGFFIGMVMMIVAFCCFMATVVAGFQIRVLVAGMIALIWSIQSFTSVFSYKGVVEELESAADERDKFLAMKSSHKTLQIINYVLSGGCFISLVLYGLLRLPVYLSIASTLCGVLVALFVILLCVNSHYEKHE